MAYPLTIRRIRSAVKAGRCSDALRMYRSLPQHVRYSDRLGKLKAAINACPRRGR